MSNCASCADLRTTFVEIMATHENGRLSAESKKSGKVIAAKIQACPCVKATSNARINEMTATIDFGQLYPSLKEEE